MPQSSKKKPESTPKIDLHPDTQHSHNRMDQYRGCAAAWTPSPFQRH